MNQVKLIIDGLYDDYRNETDPFIKTVLLKEIVWLRALASDEPLDNSSPPLEPQIPLVSACG